MNADTSIAPPPEATAKASPKWRAPGGLAPATIIGVAFLLIVVGGAVFAPWLTHHQPLALSEDALLAPSWAHPMGTDDLGRENFARVLYAARTSLSVGLFSGVIAMLFGMTIGMAAGYFGGAIDDSLMRVSEAFQVLPRLIVACIIVALFGPSFLHIILVIGLLSWPGTARVIRSRVLVLRKEEFITAAIMSGSGWGRVIWRQILPNVAPYFFVSASLQIASAILSESFLSFLGLGDPSRPGWGYLLQEGQIYMQQAWWLTAFPGVALAITILGLNLLGDGFGRAKMMTGRPR